MNAPQDEDTRTLSRRTGCGAWVAARDPLKGTRCETEVLASGRRGCRRTAAGGLVGKPEPRATIGAELRRGVGDRQSQRQSQ